MGGGGGAIVRDSAEAHGASDVRWSGLFCFGCWLLGPCWSLSSRQSIPPSPGEVWLVACLGLLTLQDGTPPPTPTEGSSCSHSLFELGLFEMKFS